MKRWLLLITLLLNGCAMQAQQDSSIYQHLDEPFDLRIQDLQMITGPSHLENTTDFSVGMQIYIDGKINNDTLFIKKYAQRSDGNGIVAWSEYDFKINTDTIKLNSHKAFQKSVTGSWTIPILKRHELIDYLTTNITYKFVLDYSKQQKEEDRKRIIKNKWKHNSNERSVISEDNKYKGLLLTHNKTRDIIIGFSDFQQCSNNDNEIAAPSIIINAEKIKMVMMCINNESVYIPQTKIGSYTFTKEIFDSKNNFARFYFNNKEIIISKIDLNKHYHTMADQVSGI